MIRPVINSIKMPRFVFYIIFLVSLMYIFSTILIAKEGYSFILSITIFIYFVFLILLLYVCRDFPIYHPVLIYIVWREFLLGVSSDYFVLFSVNEINTAVGVFHGYEAHEIIMKLFSLKIVSIIAFLLGFYTLKKLHFMRSLKSTMEIKRLSLKLVIFVILLFLLVIYLSTMVGGVGNLLNQRSVVYYERISSIAGGHYHAVIRAVPIFLALIVCVNIRYLRNPVFIASLVFSYMCVFIVTGNRSVIITSIIVIALVYAIESKKIKWGMLISMAMIVFIMFGLLGGVRSSKPNENTSSSLSDNVIFTYNEMKERAVYANGIIPILAKVPEKVDWLYGRSYLSVPFVFVPSVILPFQKPDAGGRITTKLIYQRDDTGIPPTPLGEAFWNFGLFGVFFIYFLLGFIVKIFFNNFKISPSSPIVKFVYVYSILSLSLASDNLFNFFQFVIISIIFYIIFVMKINKNMFSH